MSSGAETTAWSLARQSGQPLEVVIFQAVAYGAWKEGGIIESDWAAVLTGVLHGTHSWRRQTYSGIGDRDGPLVTEKDGATVASERVPAGIAPGDSEAEFAGTVLANLGIAVEIGGNDLAYAQALSTARLGSFDGNSFTGFADEAVTWSALAAGELTVAELVDP